MWLNMNLIYFLVLSILKIQLTKSSVLLWSNKKIDIRPLQKFGEDDLLFLVEKMEYPEVMAYTNPNQQLPPKYSELIYGFSAFNTNEDLIGMNTTDLTGNEEADFQKIKEDSALVNQENRNVLFLIISPNHQRMKRELDEEETATTTPEIKGPVVYIGKSKTDEGYGIIYSSQPLLLKINTTDIYLGETYPDRIYVDTVPKSSITRLNVNIPQSGGGKIMLQFIFSWLNDYWYLTTVKINVPDDTYDLTLEGEAVAPSGFSYHCSGLTRFSDSSNDVSLLLTDMQVQIDAEKESFDDAYDCISFTTVPIWSGIMVSGLLIVVLMISLIALGDIKTMDTFDNHKTKQLTITVSE